MAAIVESTGHEKIVLQSDQDAAIVDVKRKAGKHTRTSTVYEEISFGDSSANGAIERANQTIAIKDFTETMLG